MAIRDMCRIWRVIHWSGVENAVKPSIDLEYGWGQGVEPLGRGRKYRVNE